jgi:hypothetical protein
VAVAVSAAVLLSGLGRLREVVERSLITAGFNIRPLPIAALTAFLVGGAQPLSGFRHAGTQRRDLGREDGRQWRDRRF